MRRVRVRGIYATALTEHLRAAHEIVQASAPIERRFEASFRKAPHDVTVATTDDRQGVGVVGADAGVDAVLEDLKAIGIDTLAWRDPTPKGAVMEATVTETLGSGAVVDLGPRQGFLPYDAVGDHVAEGDTHEVQVHEPVAPWADHRPTVASTRRVFGGVVDLVRGMDGVDADVHDPDRGTELARTTELLGPSIPDGWGVQWQSAAASLEMEGLGEALETVVDRATADSSDDTPQRATAWVWFGRDSRFALDERRGAVTETMPGHHRIKAGERGASTAVDFVERLWRAGAIDVDGGDSEEDTGFAASATLDQFGPLVGDEIDIVHGKPDGRAFSLGTAAVVDRDGATLTVERQIGGGGTYDGLGTPKESGDVAETTLKEGRWWYPTTYRGADGEAKGTYVNVCTPLELFPEAARYVDLHVDVVRRPDGAVERVDDDELDEAVEAGSVPPALASKARDVANAVTNALS